MSTVVSIDPAATNKSTSDETGIIVVGIGNDADGYVLDDKSGRMDPDDWGTTAWEAAIHWGVTAIVVEDNQGGDMVEHVLMSTWAKITAQYRANGKHLPPRPPIMRVHPSGAGQGKWVRAQPIKALYEQHRIHHVSDPENVDLSILEDQATSWTGDPAQDSPDRTDGLVHGLTWLMFPQQRKGKNNTPVQRGPRWGGMRGR